MSNLKTPNLDHACLIVHGKDQPGIVASVTPLITRHRGNIVALDQYSDDPAGGHFFQRIVFTRNELSVAMPDIEADLKETLGAMDLNWTLSDLSAPKRMAILASTSDHCLLDLLWRHRRGELPVTIPMVISNHTAVAKDVQRFGVPFFHVPSAGPDKSAAEEEILKLLIGNVDFIVLARYMQILSGDFLRQSGVPVINIHHSFLPAFIGAAPYKKAKERGVKLIGATSHYVTEELDEGPIIEQDTIRVNHSDTVGELMRRGADVERQVLSRAVLWHAQDRVIRHGNQTVVFAQCPAPEISAKKSAVEFEDLDVAMITATHQILGIDVNEAFEWFSQHGYIGVKCIWKRGCFCRQVTTNGTLLSLMDVADRVSPDTGTWASIMACNQWGRGIWGLRPPWTSDGFSRLG